RVELSHVKQGIPCAGFILYALEDGQCLLIVVQSFRALSKGSIDQTKIVEFTRFPVLVSDLFIESQRLLMVGQRLLRLVGIGENLAYVAECARLTAFVSDLSLQP